MGFVSKQNLITVLTDFRTRIGTEIQNATPKSLSELVNDATFMNGSEVQAKADAALNDAKQFADNAVNELVQFKTKKVDVLPSVEEGKENIIYLVPNTLHGNNNVYDEFLLLNGKWEKLGTTAVDLSPYDNGATVDSKIEAAKTVGFSDQEVQDVMSSVWA